MGLTEHNLKALAKLLPRRSAAGPTTRCSGNASVAALLEFTLAPVYGDGHRVDSSTELVKVRLDDGSEIKFEAASPGGERDVVDYERVINADSVAKTIESTVRMLQGTLERLKPDKASVKFGVKIAVESGQLTALVVKGSGEGNLEVTFEWGK